MYIRGYRSLSVSLLFFLFASCASTGPNQSLLQLTPKVIFKYKIDSDYISAREILVTLEKRNRLLAVELGKIPELQTSISAENIIALANVKQAYFSRPALFNHVFEKMYSIGNADIRRYNTPLQALFWLAKDGKTDEIGLVLQEYSLNHLLNRAWILKNTEYLHRWKWQTAQARRLYESCKDENLKRQILNFFKENRGATDYIISLYDKYPDAFGYQMQRFEGNLADSRKRWKNFKSVINRINSPELVQYYIMNEYSFDPDKQLAPASVFKFKYGDSASMALLGLKLLGAAGYHTFLRSVTIEDSECISNHTGAGIVMENGLYLLVVDFPKGKTISGPFDTNTLDIELRTGHCYPPPSLPFNIPIPDFVQNITRQNGSRLFAISVSK